MNIVFLTTGLGVGGAEKQICILADELFAKGNNVTIISLSGISALRPENPSIPIYEIRMQKNIFSLIRAFLSIKKILSKNEVDILHSHMFHANIFSRILRIFTNIPKLICTAHSTNEGGYLRMLAYRMTNGLSNFNTNVSQEAVDIFIRKKAVKETQMIALPNGFNQDKYQYSEDVRKKIRAELNLSNDNYLFLSVGRLCDAKDFPNLLNSFKLVLKDHPLSRLVIAGDGPLKDDLLQLCDNLGIRNEVHFLGRRDDISYLLSACDTFVLSSKYEGLPLVIGEAMSCERYIVATDCGGVRHIVNQYGKIVPPRNTIKLSISMIESISIEKKTKNDIGIKAKEHIKNNFSIEKIAKKWLNLYKNC